MNIKPSSMTYNTCAKSINNLIYKIKPSKSIPVVSMPIVMYYIGEIQDQAASDILQFFKDKNIDLPLGASTGVNNNGFSASTKIGIRNKLKNAYKQGTITEEEYKKYDNKVAFTGKDEDINTNSASIEEPTSFLDNIQNRFSEGLENLKEKIADSFENIKDNIHNPINNVFPHSWDEVKENLANHVGEIKENTHNIISNTFKGSNTEIHRYTIRDIAEHPELMDNLSIEEIKQIDVLMCPELEEFLQTPLDEVPDGLMSNILEDLPEGFGVGDETLYETLKGVVENATDMLG